MRKFAMFNLAAVLNAVSYPLIIIHRDDSICFANTATEKLTGYDKAALSTLSLTQLIHPDFHSMLSLGKGEFKLLTAQKQPVWVAFSGEPVEYDGRPSTLMTLMDISARKQAEVMPDAHLFHAVLSSTFDMIVVYGCDDRFLYANATALRTQNLKLEDVVGKTWRELGFPEKYGIVREQLRAKVLSDGEAVTTVLPFPTVQGERIFEEILQPIFDSSGQAIAIVMTGRDITDRQKMEETLLHNQRFIEHIAETIPDVIHVYDLQERRNIYANREVTRMLGYTPEILQEMGPAMVDTLMHPEDIAKQLQHAYRFLEADDGEIIENTFRWRHMNGEWRWVLTRDTVFTRNPDGSPRQVLGVAQDITDRKTAEEALLRSEARLQYLFTNAPVAIFSAQPEGDFAVQFVSNNVLQLTGFTPQELTTDPTLWMNRIHPDDAPWVKEKLNETLLTDENSYEYRFLCKEGSYKWTHEEVRLIRDSQGSPSEIVGYWQDISQRKQMESALLLQERLQVALQKEKELGDLKSKMMVRISHEFRTPLSVITMSSELLQHYYEKLSPEKRELHFQRIKNGVLQLASLLDDTSIAVKGLAEYLDFTPVPFDLTQLCQEVAEEARGNFAANHSLELMLPPTPLPIIADQDLVRRILLNLLSNAVKFSAKGKTIQLIVASEFDRCLLHITDQGIGITLDDQSHLFEPFFRGSNVGETQGLGLGLCIVQNAVDLHRGRITVESTPDEGARFTVHLPLSQ